MWTPGVCILFSSVENAEIEDSGEWIFILVMGLSLHTDRHCYKLQYLYIDLIKYQDSRLVDPR